jgi:putative ABC transport system permease protein
MFVNYFITAWRNLLKNKVISAINILGLTLGLASAVLVILYALRELSFEDCHEKADRICRVFMNGNFGDLQRVPQTFGPEGEGLENMFPEIEAYTISRSMSTTVRVGENIFFEDDITFADTNTCRIFTIPFIKGNISRNPQSAVLSEEAATRYFGNDDPIGKSIRINCYGIQTDFEVTGIFKNFPTTTHLKADFIIPFEHAKRFYMNGWRYNEYQSSNYNTYILLKPGTNIVELNKKILENFKIPIEGVFENLYISLMPLKDLHFKGTFENNKGKLMVFLLGGIFVLIISCLNYINLTNILFSLRIKETGIRKVNGAKRYQVFAQFMTDTLFATLISLNLAIVLLKLIIPWFNTRMNTQIELSPGQDELIAIIFLLIVTSVLSGLYPALRYSAMKPVSLMKQNAGNHSGKGYSRWILTTFQLILGIVFIQVILIINKEGRHLNSIDITRFNSDNVIIMNGNPWGNLNTVKTELLKNTEIEAVSWGNELPGLSYNITNQWKDEQNKTMAMPLYFAPDYMNVFMIKMKSGRFFSEDFPSDKQQSIVINDKTAQELGYSDPVGRQMMAYGRQYTIIGVTDDYLAVARLFEKLPILITYSNDLNEYLFIRVKPENREITHQFIAKTLKSFNSEFPIEIRYYDDIANDAAKSYISAERLMNVFSTLTIITTLIGIFGLSLFIGQRYRKQIGIRKVHGASIPGIMLKLSRGLIIQAVIAILISTPVAYIIGQQYLSIFAYRIEPGILLFLFGGLLVVAMLLLTVSWQTWRAATDNPVNSLRYE